MSHLGRLAVANTSSPQCLANCTAAEPNATRRGMDEDRLPRPHVGQPPQSVVRGGEDDQRRRGLGIRPAAGHRCHQPHVGRDERPGALGEEPHHPVADGESGDVGADLDHDARALAAEQRVMGEHAQCDHDVAEVGAHRVHSDADVTRPQRLAGVGHVLQCQVVERAGSGEPEPPRLARIRRRKHAVDPTAAHHPRRVWNTFSHNHLRLTDGQHGRDVQFTAHVGEHDAARILGLRRAHQTPDGGTGQIGDVLTGQRHRATRAHHQHTGRLGQPLLHPGERCQRDLVYPGDQVGGIT